MGASRLPEDAMSAPVSCQHCGEQYAWIDTADGKRPKNLEDGRFHWFTCKRFSKERRSKWRTARAKRKRAAQDPMPVKITGPDFRPVESDALPWEDETVAEKLLLAEQA